MTIVQQLDPAMFAAELDAELTRRFPTAAVLPEHDRALLLEGGLRFGGPATAAGKRARAARAAREVGLLSSAATVAEAAAELGLSASRVRHRIADGSLRAVKVGREQRIPRWQLGVPQLAAVLEAVPDDWSQVSLESFATVEQPDLDGASVVTWLRDGGDVERVLDLLRSSAF